MTNQSYLVVSLKTAQNYILKHNSFKIVEIVILLPIFKKEMSKIFFLHAGPNGM